MKKLDFLDKVVSQNLLPFLITFVAYQFVGINDWTLIGFVKVLAIAAVFITIKHATLDVFIRDRKRLRAVLAKADKDVQDWGKK